MTRKDALVVEGAYRLVIVHNIVARVGLTKGSLEVKAADHD